MFCQNCGAPNEEHDIFCSSCGARLETKTTECAETGTSGTFKPVQPMPYNHMTAPTAPVQKPKAKMTLPLIAVLAESVLIVCLLVAIPLVLRRSFSAEHVAEKYFVSIVNGKYKDAYQLHDLPEGEFLNEDAFENYCVQRDLGTVTNYNVVSEKEKKDIDWYYDVADSTLGKTVVIRYRTSGDESDNYYVVNVTKNAKKKFLFFDDWTVGYSSIIIQDYDIVVSEGASVTVDGVVLDKKYIVDDDSYYEKCDVYNIPLLFAGEHKMEVNAEGMQPLEASIYISYDYDYADLTNMYYTKEQIEELQKKSYDNMQIIYSAAAEGKPFSDIAALFTSNREIRGQIEQEYAYLVAYFEGGQMPISLTLDSVVANANTHSSQIELLADYTITFYNQDWWTGEFEEKTYSETETLYFTYVNEDGNWLLESLGCEQLYYW